MHSRMGLIVAGCLAGSIAVCAQVYAQKIVRVVTPIGAHAYAAPTRLEQSRRMIKFVDERAVQASPPVYDVVWEAPATPLDEPIAVRMEYKQLAGRKAHVLVADYGPRTRGQHIARFRIPPDELAERGAVIAWRIQIRQGARVLDERVMGRWNED